MNYNKYIDDTLLKQDATSSQIIVLCKEAKEYSFKSVCVNPDFVSLAKNELKDSDVLVCTVIGFPLGANTTATKVFETKDALNNGADEIDMVINVSKVKDNDDKYVKEEISKIKEVCGNHTLKVILETCLLTKEEIKRACLLAKEAGADFVKTSTGFSTYGAKVEDVKLMRETVGNEMGVKASGGIRTHQDMLDMINAGATRIGTSSGAKLMK
ncbi:MAG: deoxyribose-phosphate aldolase [Firmicutes bacterium]|uniref:Deoxyribose-phosphate aldolase n=1 Tax=Candidatus Onthovivens merdipullorum TaxID=2840889 RepID=A0A9D9DIA2_9BACL|nr:deoxyribose-phosphate aldolase [Candidatus Onthovivens merdipullorum]